MLTSSPQRTFPSDKAYTPLKRDNREMNKVAIQLQCKERLFPSVFAGTVRHNYALAFPNAVLRAVNNMFDPLLYGTCVESSVV